IGLAVAFISVAGGPTRALASYVESCGRSPPLLVLATAWAGERLPLAWGAAAAALALVALGRRALLGGRVPLVGGALRERARGALALRALAGLVKRGVPLPRAWSVATALLDTAASEGASPAAVLEASG